MFNRSSSLLLAVTCLFLILNIVGCATLGPTQKTATIAPPPAEVASSEGWWFAQFRMHWPKEESASWHWDLLIADKIVAPVLAKHRDQIILWRFHRRAIRDKAGHQFSFIFYASAATAYQVISAIRANELLAEMKYDGVIKEDLYDNPDKITKPRIEDTSDASWPPVIQRNWPYFIMGVSQMWLNLIGETVADRPALYTPLSVRENEQVYEKANATITDLWENEGQHALLHHLSGIFGYKPILFTEQHKLKF